MSATDLVEVRRALLSVSDKTNLVDFAQGLHELGVQLVSTGGTFRTLQDAGLPAIEISTVTECPEMMDGRVKTLHPKKHGARWGGGGWGIGRISNTLRNPENPRPSFLII